MKNRDDMLALGAGLALIGDLFILAAIAHRRKRADNSGLFIPKTTAQAIAQHVGREAPPRVADKQNT